jgi:FkbM family methyltransferase
MRQSIKDAFRKLVYRLPRSKAFYLMARVYADRYLNDSDHNAITNGEYRLLRAVIPADRPVTLIDVGANRGDWTAAALAHNPQARIHVFEPDPRPFAAMQARSFPPSIRLNAFAVGDERESRTFHRAANSQLNSLYAEEAAARPMETTMTVEIETLDHYCADHGIDQIDYLKVDVEGHDLPVLRGAADMLSQGRIAYAQFEYGPNWVLSRTFLRDAFDFAASVNCTVYKVMPSGLQHHPTYHTQMDSFRLAYFVLRPRGA